MVGLQVVVQGLPWAYTSEHLEPMFEPYGVIEQCEVVYGRDNRSRVRCVPHLCDKDLEFRVMGHGQSAESNILSTAPGTPRF